MQILQQSQYNLLESESQPCLQVSLTLSPPRLQVLRTSEYPKCAQSPPRFLYRTLRSFKQGINFTFMIDCRVKWRTTLNTRSSGGIPVPENKASSKHACLQFCAENLDCVAVEVSPTLSKCSYFRPDQKSTQQQQHPRQENGTDRYQLLDRCHKSTVLLLIHYMLKLSIWQTKQNVVFLSTKSFR